MSRPISILLGHSCNVLVGGLTILVFIFGGFSGNWLPGLVALLVAVTAATCSGYICSVMFGGRPVEWSLSLALLPILFTAFVAGPDWLFRGSFRSFAVWLVFTLFLIGATFLGAQRGLGRDENRLPET